MPIDEIRKRLSECPIPTGAQSDWEGSSHYEIVVPESSAWPDDGDYFWLDGLRSTFGKPFDISSEQGRRVGAVLDYACAYRCDVAELLAEVDRLNGRMLECFAIFQGGGSDEPLLAIYLTRQQAERSEDYQDPSSFIVRYALDGQTGEYNAAETLLKKRPK